MLKYPDNYFLIEKKHLKLILFNMEDIISLVIDGIGKRLLADEAKQSRNVSSIHQAIAQNNQNRSHEKY